mgnify:CR=1 FL=1
MSILFVVGIYFFARGVFALYQQPIFYTKRALEHIDPADLPAYLKEIVREGDVVITMGAGDIFRAGEALLSGE